MGTYFQKALYLKVLTAHLYLFESSLTSWEAKIPSCMTVLSWASSWPLGGQERSEASTIRNEHD
eukprot:6121402-Pyramimonas_sp.AAC.1